MKYYFGFPRGENQPFLKVKLSKKFLLMKKLLNLTLKKILCYALKQFLIWKWYLNSFFVFISESPAFEFLLKKVNFILPGVKVYSV